MLLFVAIILWRVALLLYSIHTTNVISEDILMIVVESPVPRSQGACINFAYVPKPTAAFRTVKLMTSMIISSALSLIIFPT
jgi:hypothetical protein